MRFSVIIPAHNSEKYIEKALKSVRRQTYKDYELIVICDDCTDKTYEVALKYADKVRAVTFGRDGLTRNAGIDIAEGDWILFMDDDDWWIHEYVLKELSEMIDKHGDKVDIFAFAFIFKGRGYASPIGNNGYRYISCWSKCFKRSFIGSTRFSDRWAWSDVDFNKEIMKKKPRIYDLEMLMYYYNYLRPGSISEREGKK